MPRTRANPTHDNRILSRDVAINSLDFALQAFVWIGISAIAIALAVGF
ncbi:MAG: hypothetical protein IT438_13690 [Phycisphaerales bacterium]|nr:hypothetical protein [Phycisphaerales bacterium]